MTATAAMAAMTTTATTATATTTAITTTTTTTTAMAMLCLVVQANKEPRSRGEPFRDVVSQLAYKSGKPHSIRYHFTIIQLGGMQSFDIWL